MTQMTQMILMTLMTLMTLLTLITLMTLGRLFLFFCRSVPPEFLWSLFVLVVLGALQHSYFVKRNEFLNIFTNFSFVV